MNTYRFVSKSIIIFVPTGIKNGGACVKQIFTCKKCLRKDCCVSSLVQLRADGPHEYNKLLSWQHVSWYKRLSCRICRLVYSACMYKRVEPSKTIGWRLHSCQKGSVNAGYCAACGSKCIMANIIRGSTCILHWELPDDIPGGRSWFWPVEAKPALSVQKPESNLGAIFTFLLQGYSSALLTRFQLKSLPHLQQIKTAKLFLSGTYVRDSVNTYVAHMWETLLTHMWHISVKKTLFARRSRKESLQQKWSSDSECAGSMHTNKICGKWIQRTVWCDTHQPTLCNLAHASSSDLSFFLSLSTYSGESCSLRSMKVLSLFTTICPSW